MTEKQTRDNPLSYTITNGDKMCGQGDINSIIEGNGFWRSYIGNSSTRIVCQLQSICIVASIEVKVANAVIIEFTAYFATNQQYAETKNVTWKQRETDKAIIYRFKNEGKKVDELVVEFHSLNGKQVTISSVAIFGTVVGERKKTKQKERKVDKQIFKERVKEKQSTKVPRKIQKEQPKIESKPPQKQKGNLSIVVPEYYSSSQLMDPQEMQMIADYVATKVKQSQLDRLTDVGEHWLECQRRMEAGFGVIPEHSLALKINSKCLQGVKVCFANVTDSQLTKYIRIVKELGGQIREEPCQGCLILTDQPKDSPIVNLARIMANTHIVRLSYLDQCHRNRMKVKINKYEYSPQDFFT